MAKSSSQDTSTSRGTNKATKSKSSKEEFTSKKEDIFVPDPNCTYPTLDVSVAASCGRTLFYPENHYARELMNCMNERRFSYTRDQLRALKGLGLRST
jgi:hypothetical protein